MAVLPTVTNSLRASYNFVASHLSSLYEKSKQLSYRVYQAVLPVFRKIKEGMIRVLEWTLTKMGSPQQKKINRLETDLKVNARELLHLRKEYEASAVKAGTPLFPLPGASADVNDLREKLAKANKKIAEEQVKNAELAAQIQSLLPLKTSLNEAKDKLTNEEAKVGVLKKEKDQLQADYERALKQAGVVDPFRTSGTF